MFAIGFDCGYSNLKIAFGDIEGKAPETMIRPSGAGPADRLPTRIGDTAADDRLYVTVRDTRYVAGVEHHFLQGMSRELHRDYPSTDAYMALYLGSLVLAGREQVDEVVTGLPVNQFAEKALRQTLADRLTGEFGVAPKRKVAVRRVTVLPQPAGAYLDWLAGVDDFEFVENAKIVVVDPGFFSVDFVVMQGGQILDAQSTTSTQAMSVVLAEANRLIAEDFGGGVGIEGLERAVRGGTRKVLVHGTWVDTPPYLARASATVATEAVKELKTALRTGQESVDLIILAGGGGETFQDVVKGMFPRAKVWASEDPTLANARGFWQYAKRRR